MIAPHAPYIWKFFPPICKELNYPARGQKSSNKGREPSCWADISELIREEGMLLITLAELTGNQGYSQCIQAHAYFDTTMYQALGFSAKLSPIETFVLNMSSGDHENLLDDTITMWNRNWILIVRSFVLYPRPMGAMPWTVPWRPSSLRLRLSVQNPEPRI